MVNIVELLENASPRIFRKRWFIPGIAVLWRDRYSRQACYFSKVNTKCQLYLGAAVANLTLVDANMGLAGDTDGTSCPAGTTFDEIGYAEVIFGVFRLRNYGP